MFDKLLSSVRIVSSVCGLLVFGECCEVGGEACEDVGAVVGLCLSSG